MVSEMTGGYGLIVPSMLATTIAFVVERAVSAGFKYPRLYEAQVEQRSDSPTHHASIIRAAFTVLERGPLVDLRNVTFPHLASLLSYGTPISIHEGEGKLLAVKISEDSPLVGRRIEETFDQFPDLVAAAIIRGQRVELPRGSTCLQGKDQLLIVTNETNNLDTFVRIANGNMKKPN